MTQPPLSETFTREQVLCWLDARTIAKGEEYLERVRGLVVTPRRISAEVQGTARQPYRVRVHFLENSSTKILGECSCPLGGNCKHVAATLFVALAARQEDGERVSPGVLSWITDLRHLSQAVEKTRSQKKETGRTRLFYQLENEAGEVRVLPLKGLRPDAARLWALTERALIQPPQFVEEDDLPVLRLLWTNPTGAFTHKKGTELLQKLLATGRLVASSRHHAPAMLTEGPTRPGKIVWQAASHQQQRPLLVAEPEADMLIPVNPPWYVDIEAGWIGPLKMDLPPDLAQKLLVLPPLSPREAALVADALAEVAPDAPKPITDLEAHCRVIAAQPHGELRLDTLRVEGIYGWRDYQYDYHVRHFDYAEATLCYGEARLPFDDPREYLTLPSGELLRLVRQPKEEARLLKQLAAQGLEMVPNRAFYCFGERPARLYGLASEADWKDFMQEGRESLTQSGWQVSHTRQFRHYFLEVEAWEAHLSETGEGSGWLDLDMGVVVEGRRLALAPLLAGLFQRDKRWLDALSLADIAPDEAIELVTGDESRLRIPAERLKPLARLLIDLFDGYRDGVLKISRFDAPRLEMLRDKSRWQFHGPESVLALAERLKATQGVQDVAPPAGFKLALRDYQREGLAWLQYLREHQLAGILADDMGLGKTAQALAHLLLEKESGRLDRPALVVLPTSLIFNWKNEAKRFAPDLKILSLHGQDRKPLFADIPNHDVVLTTYPLLWRDGEVLTQYDYHLLILDEAQTVKNSRSKSAGVVRQLTA
ncbi:MAG: helicase, partial [Zoogloeaceae bacterium]|nr:helicase [Zoogloeaceae bacterium]